MSDQWRELGDEEEQTQATEEQTPRSLQHYEEEPQSQDVSAQPDDESREAGDEEPAESLQATEEQTPRSLQHYEEEPQSENVSAQPDDQWREVGDEEPAESLQATEEQTPRSLQHYEEEPQSQDVSAQPDDESREAGDEEPAESLQATEEQTPRSLQHYEEEPQSENVSAQPQDQWREIGDEEPAESLQATEEQTPRSLQHYEEEPQSENVSAQPQDQWREVGNEEPAESLQATEEQTPRSLQHYEEEPQSENVSAQPQDQWREVGDEEQTPRNQQPDEDVSAQPDDESREAADEPRHQTRDINIAAVPLGERDTYLKPKVNYQKRPARWEPVDAQPDGDSDDEFEFSTCMAPVYEGEGEPGNEDPSVFKNGYPDCDMTGKEITSCFDEPILYRIVDPEQKTWAFYNDSTEYEVHVEFTFGKNSKLNTLENTTIEQDDRGEYVCRTVVYPTETEMFVQGRVNGYTSKLRAIALSENYHAAMRAITEKKIGEEQDAINQITQSQDAEEVLAACIENNVMFVDPEFPPVQASIDNGAKKPMKELAWARPQMFLPEEMADQIRLFRIPPIPGKVDPGDLGDSWVMCSVAAVTEDRKRLVGMFRHPDGKEAAQREHAVGAYRVTFCKNGWWRTVLVDSYLPVSGGRPKYAKSMNDPAEIWPSVLEKAYAKLHGSYARIITGDPLHALHDMTGFSTLRFDSALAESSTKRRDEDELFQDLMRGIRAGYTIIVNTPGKDPKAEGADSDLVQQYKSVGLLTGHAYTILDAKEFPDHDISIVKIRNAWGHGIEWNGEWGDNDDRWNQYPDIAEECNFQKADDGTFWITWEETQKYFNGGGICFSHTPAYDYRINSAFNSGVPSCVLEVEVSSPTWFTFVISQEDKLSREEGYAYQPVMLSVAEPESETDYKVLLNSSVNGVRPSPDKWTFLKGRDISLIHKFEAGKYLVVPRVYVTGDLPEQVPYVLGVIANREIGSGEVDVKFHAIDPACRVFENLPRFPASLTEVEDVQYQKRPPGAGFPATLQGSRIE